MSRLPMIVVAAVRHSTAAVLACFLVGVADALAPTDASDVGDNAAYDASVLSAKVRVCHGFSRSIAPIASPIAISAATTENEPRPFVASGEQWIFRRSPSADPLAGNGLSEVVSTRPSFSWL